MYRNMLIIFTLLLTGCASTVSLKEAIKGIESDLENYSKETGYISFSDLLSDNEESRKAVENYIKKRQELFNRSNPLIIVAAEKMDLSIKGVISKDMGFKVSSVFTTNAEAGFKVTKGLEQGVTWPVEIVSLGALPDIYYETTLKNLSEAKISTELKMDSKKIEELLNEIEGNKKTIKERIDRLQKDFVKHCEYCEHCECCK